MSRIDAAHLAIQATRDHQAKLEKLNRTIINALVGAAQDRVRTSS